jgi:hypothetical protein
MMNVDVFGHGVQRRSQWICWEYHMDEHLGYPYRKLHFELGNMDAIFLSNNDI